jgi:Family of unknown function (DUF6212)
MSIIAKRSLWADLDSADCSVILSTNLGRGVVADITGLRVWYFRQSGEDVVLLRGMYDDVDGDEVAVVRAPPALLAVVSGTEQDGADLANALETLGGRRPPVVIASDNRQTDQILLSLMANEYRQLIADYAELQRALVETRLEYEETRTVMAAVMRTLGNRPPTSPRLGAAALLLEEGMSYQFEAGETVLGQILGLKLQGMAMVALHVETSSLTERSQVKIRLRSAESGQIFGSWKIPSHALSSGWLQLDLATPIGPVLHTGLLEINAFVAEGENLSLSFDGAAVSSGLRLRDREGSLLLHALATRIWTAEYGTRFLLPLYWDWEEVGSLPPLRGVPLSVPEQSWHLIQVLSGTVSFVALGKEAARPIAKLTETNSEAMLLQPLLHMAGLDVVRASFTVTAGLADQAEVAVWLQSLCDGRSVEPSHHGSPRWSGWRPFDSRSGRLDISMDLPIESGGSLSLLAMFRRTASAAGGFCVISWNDLVGFGTRSFDVSKLEAWGGDQTPSIAATSLRKEKVDQGFSDASFWSVQVDHYYQDEASDYEHFDLTVRGLTFVDETVWPEIRFKIARAGKHYYFEFRRRYDWPDVFVEWPGEREDEYGPVFQLSKHNAKALSLRMCDRDRDLVSAIIEVLPVVATSTSMHAGTVGRVDAFLIKAVEDLAEMRIGRDREDGLVPVYEMLD